METKFRDELGNAIPNFVPNKTIRQLMVISLFPKSKDRERIYRTLYDADMSRELSKALKEWHKRVSSSTTEWEGAIEPLKRFVKDSSSVDIANRYSSLDEFVSTALSCENNVEKNWNGNDVLGAYLTVIQKKYADLWPKNRPVRFDTRERLRLYHEREDEGPVVNSREMALLLAQD